MTKLHPTSDRFPWARFPDGGGGERFADNQNGHLYWYPRAVFVTHPHDGHALGETCFDCMDAQARGNAHADD